MGQGAANIATGFIGGMAGCAITGESVINVKSGGRERLSTLVAVMIVVSIGAFNWASFRNLREHPKSSSFVMLATVARDRFWPKAAMLAHILRVADGVRRL